MPEAEKAKPEAEKAKPEAEKAKPEAKPAEEAPKPAAAEKPEKPAEGAKPATEEKPAEKPAEGASKPAEGAKPTEGAKDDSGDAKAKRPGSAPAGNRPSSAPAGRRGTKTAAAAPEPEDAAEEAKRVEAVRKAFDDADKEKKGQLPKAAAKEALAKLPWAGEAAAALDAAAAGGDDAAVSYKTFETVAALAIPAKTTSSLKKRAAYRAWAQQVLGADADEPAAAGGWDAVPAKQDDRATFASGDAVWTSMLDCLKQNDVNRCWNTLLSDAVKASFGNEAKQFEKVWDAVFSHFEKEEKVEKAAASDAQPVDAFTVEYLRRGVLFEERRKVVFHAAPGAGICGISGHASLGAAVSSKEEGASPQYRLMAEEGKPFHMKETFKAGEGALERGWFLRLKHNYAGEQVETFKLTSSREGVAEKDLGNGFLGIRVEPKDTVTFEKKGKTKPRRLVKVAEGEKLFESALCPVPEDKFSEIPKFHPSCADFEFKATRQFDGLEADAAFCAFLDAHKLHPYDKEKESAVRFAARTVVALSKALWFDASRETADVAKKNAGSILTHGRADAAGHTNVFVSVMFRAGIDVARVVTEDHVYAVVWQDGCGWVPFEPSLKHFAQLDSSPEALSGQVVSVGPSRPLPTLPEEAPLDGEPKAEEVAKGLAAGLYQAMFRDKDVDAFLAEKGSEWVKGQAKFWEFWKRNYAKHEAGEVVEEFGSKTQALLVAKTTPHEWTYVFRITVRNGLITGMSGTLHAKDDPDIKTQTEKQRSEIDKARADESKGPGFGKTFNRQASYVLLQGDPTHRDARGQPQILYESVGAGPAGEKPQLKLLRLFGGR